MFRKYNQQIIISVVIILIISTISISGCNDSKNLSSDIETTKTDDTWDPSPVVKVNKTNFSLIFKFNTYGKDVLNTFNDTFEKDLVEGPPAIISFSLSEEELNIIYQKMIEIDFFNYPDVFSVTGYYESEPPNICYFKVKYNSRVKELSWNSVPLRNEQIEHEDEKAEKLRELIELIEDIIYSKAEYRELPEPVGAYV